MALKHPRLLIATGVYPPQSGGPATYTKMLEKTLPPLGYEVVVLPFSAVAHLPKVVRHFWYFKEVWKRGKTADIIFAQDPVSVGLPALFAARFLKKPFLLKVVGDYAWEQGRQRFGVKDMLGTFQERRYGFRVEMLRRVEHFVARRACLVIVPSEYLGSIVQGWGVASEKIRRIYNGVDFTEALEPVTAKPSGRLIVTAGRLVPWKHVDGIMGAIVPEPEWSLVVVGDGPERKTLEGCAHELCIEDRVKFLGALSRSDALNWFAAGEVFVLNSSYEGLSHVLLEVMGMGTPVIATDVGGNPEVIQDGVNGLLVPPGNSKALHDALSRVLNDALLAHQLGQKGKQRAREFSIETTVRELNAVLESI